MEKAAPVPRPRVAFVGTGNIARMHAQALNALDDAAEIAAVCDIVEERAREFGCRYGGAPYTDLAAMLVEERPDAVLISTPNYLHAPVTVTALETGAHVFCEKPIATSMAAATLMQQTAERVNRVLYIGFNHRFVGKFTLAKSLLESGEYGGLLVARVAAGHGGYAVLPPWFRERAKAGGGALLDLGVHMIDLLRWLGHGITEVSAQTHPLPAEYGDVEDNGFALFRLGDGGMASLLCSWTWPPTYQSQFQLICEGGTIDLTGDQVMVLRTGEETPRPLETPKPDIWVAQMRRFLAAVRGEEPPYASAQDGLATLEVVLAAYESAQTKRTISLLHTEPPEASA